MAAKRKASYAGGLRRLIIGRDQRRAEATEESADVPQCSWAEGW